MCCHGSGETLVAEENGIPETIEKMHQKQLQKKKKTLSIEEKTTTRDGEKSYEKGTV
jgi:hypothetical protein